MKRNHFSSMMLTVCLCWMPAQFVFAQNAIGQISLYDNMELPRAGVIGPRLESKQRDLAQQFVMGDSDNVSSISLFLNRRGSPRGEVGVEIWENGGSGVPSSLVTSVGTIDLQDLSSSPEEVTLETLVTGLSPNARYHVVLNNENTTISSIQNSYRMGLLGQSNNEQSEGTNGATRILSSSPTMFNGEWRPYLDALAAGCWLSSCPNYLRMSVTAAALLGDFDQDGSLDADDIDQLSLQLRTTPDNRSFDLNNDATLSQADREVWVRDLANTFFGDADMDGDVDFADFLTLSENFGSPDHRSRGWSQGDFDGDREVGFPDFLALSANFGGVAAANASAASVPEPAGLSIALFGILGLIGFRRRR